MTSPQPDELNLLLICSSGGHLAQLMSVRDWWCKHPRHWVSFDLPDVRARLADESVTWAYHPTTRSIPNLLRNTLLAIRVMQQRRPDVIVSTGAGVAVPFFLVARLLGVPAIFIEVIDRFDTPTLTGRICQWLTPYIGIQLPEQRKVYPRARLIGPML